MLTPLLALSIIRPALLSTRVENARTSKRGIANAGIPFNAFGGDVSLMNDVTFGVIIGLVFGKLMGVAGATWLGKSLGLGALPKGCNMLHIVGVAR